MVSRRSWALLFVASMLALGVSCGPATTDEALGQVEQALATFPNEKPAFDFFVMKGLTPAQSAGIVGNLDLESGVDPAAVQNGGPGRGIAQWSVGARWDTTAGDNVKAFAAQKGQSMTSLTLQLEFVWFELQTFPAYGLASLRTQTTAAGAATAFAKDFEGCGSCSTATRIAYAENVLARFGGAADAGPSGPPCSLASGETGVCISTTDCAALGHHISTAGLCPGAKDIQCCTPDGTMPSASEDAGAPAADDGGAEPSPTEDGARLPAIESSGCAASPRPVVASVLVLPSALLLLALTQRRRRRM